MRVISNPPSLYRKADLNLQAPLDTELYVTESFYQLIMFSEAPIVCARTYNLYLTIKLKLNFPKFSKSLIYLFLIQLNISAGSI